LHYIYRQHGDYSAAGASGAVSGLIFASIALFPGMKVGLFLIFLPSWLYAILYVAYSIYGIKSKRDNIGHEAHLGGALIGMIVAIIIRPDSLSRNLLPILIVFIPTIAFIVLTITKPQILLIDNLYFKTHSNHYDIDHSFNEARVNKQKEIDRLLDKISQKGIDSLTQKEKQILKEYSK
jgi:hypothetical protein